MAETPGAASSASVDEGPVGYVLRDQLALWDVVDGEARFKTSLTLGEGLKMLGEVREATYQGAQRTYTRVRRKEGTEGWVRSDYISSGTPAVVLSEAALLFTRPENTHATGESLPQLFFVVVQADFQDAVFAKVSLFDPQKEVIRPAVYLKRADLADRPQDVRTAILLGLASATEDNARKEALLELALSDYPGSRFVGIVEEALAALSAPAASAAPTERFFATFLVRDDRVRVRSVPDVEAGTILAQLQMGQKVEVEEKTRADATIEGVSAPWYRVREPAGWVFGAFLKPEE